ncbi:DUF4301 family protein [Odoribacter sp. OttesenSCG-928-G04]|nr:DUF4301 family protein [Odoribacter sp. OttesenSCG-928-G04]MDL2331278.1 DUF4301 family protein [Odoribacter sp. OttesenSCG-928-A06]
MKYTREDLKTLKARGIKKEEIERQLSNFERGFDFADLIEPATPDNGIRIIQENEKKYLIDLYDKASQKADIVKMVPASGSASRMFKDLYTFKETYTGSTEDFLKLVQEKEYDSINGFFLRLEDFPFYSRLQDVIWSDGKDLKKMLEKRMYTEILDYILTEKGLNYGDMPKALIDFHIYRDFVRTAFDEHFVEAAMYAKRKKEAHLHFTVSEQYIPLFKERLNKIAPVFEKMFKVKYHVTFSIQKPSTDTISVYKNGEVVRDEKGKIMFRPGGHGALIHNLDEIKADVVFIKNIDNVIPDRSKADTVTHKKLLAGLLLEMQSKIFEKLEQLDKRSISDKELEEIDCFIEKNLGYKKPESFESKNKKERIKHFKNILNRPIRVCGMVKNEGEPGGGPFWVKGSDGGIRLMIIESAQVDVKNKDQKKVFDKATHFNPVDIVCGTRDHKGKHFNLSKFIDEDQGFISLKSYKGKEIKVQELPGLWNGAMAKWTTLFVEVPLSTFTPVKTVYDLRRTEHTNVFSNHEGHVDFIETRSENE